MLIIFYTHAYLIVDTSIAKSNTAPLVVGLEHPHCCNVALVGGKAAALAQLVKHYRVPPGFCVTTAAFTRWRTQGGHWLAETMPPAYQTLVEQSGLETPAVAVRSSAVGEDGQTTSFAGLYDTYLNVVGLDAVITAIQRCWETAHSERVETYLTQQGHSLPDTRLAVLVQQFIPADVSVVAFSANPVSGQRDEVVLNSSWGLGESIVSSKVTPDTFTVNKHTGHIKRTLAPKKHMTVVNEHTTQDIPVPRIMQRKPSLTEAQIQAVVALAIQLEQTMGYPVDIEGAYYQNTLFLLQCRPITTLHPFDEVS